MNEIYAKLAKTTLPPADHSELFLRLLAEAMTPEEAEFILALPASAAALAKQFGLTEAAVAKRIHNLMERGLVHPTPKGPVFYHEIALLRDEVLASAPQFVTPELHRLWKEYYDTVLQHELTSWFVNTQPLMLRIVPARKAVPKDVELLPWEDIHEIIKASKTSTVRDCCCRIMVDACDLPRHVCVQFNGRADYAVLRGAAEEVTVEQVFKTAEEAEEAGLVPMVANVANLEHLEYLCYCCGCCCVVIDPLKREGQLKEGLAKSRFEATVNNETCTGCQKCVKRCQFDAITMEKIPGSKKQRAVVDAEQCWGCGACVLTCKPEALTLAVVRPPEYIPSVNPNLIP
ncbi:MAG: 4Fe-4S binding protein [Desulfuromonadales bacterium]|nr:4Fe-4S binding protein [Desulfuromonadales bacterium]